MSKNVEKRYAKLMKMASQKMAKLQAELDALKRVNEEPLAIIGIGCRFPGGAETVESPDSFWQLLRDGVDAIREVPKERWDLDAYYDENPETPGKMYTRYGGFINQLHDFDANFFSLSPREAVSIDPQQRLLLEVSWEALEHAGIVPDNLMGSRSGVFIGIWGDDYNQQLVKQEPAEIDAYLATGNAHSVAAGRLSYFYGLQGPSLAVDTACSSSLVSVHLACQSLRQKECNLALAGGVNLLLSPEFSINFSKARMLAPDGRCKTFDASANGYVRAEGCGVIVLKRLSDAVANGDRILALIRGSAVNQDGRSQSLTAPNGPSQQAVIRQALENARVRTDEVSYIEAHGTGTSLGDPIEVGALGAVFSDKRSAPLLIGSAKTNIGHLEAAAGIAGLIKVVLSLQHGEIPPHLHFKTPNPYLSWDELPVKVPTTRTPWVGVKRIAGVSSFGFSGTNAHVVLEAAPAAPIIELSEQEQRVEDHLLTLSAKTEAALDELITAYANYLVANPDICLADICLTANTGRSHFQHRYAMVAQNAAEMSQKLSQAAERQANESPGIWQSPATLADTVPIRGEVAFLFTGQGSQYVGMGRELYETQPTFRKTVEQCDEIWRSISYLNPSLIDILFRDESRLNQTAYTQVALFALEYALAKLWESWGVVPDVVMGHSVGELVAACVAGVFSLEDGLKLVTQRGRLMQSTQKGEMAALFTSEERVKAAIGKSGFFAHQIAIAAINGPQLTVISGHSQAVQRLVRVIEAEGIRTKKLEVSHAFHSPLMEPILGRFRQVARQITFSSPQITLISNLTGEMVTDDVLSPEYWVRHIRQPVRFADSMNRLREMGVETFVEIGPKPTLLGMGRRIYDSHDPDGYGTWLPSLRPNKEWATLLASVAQLYVHGYEIDWEGFNQDDAKHRRRIVLPTYPFQRERYWIDSAAKPSNTQEQTDIASLLQQADMERLVQQLAVSDELTPTERELLPKVLNLLAKQPLLQSLGNGHEAQKETLASENGSSPMEAGSSETGSQLLARLAETPGDKEAVLVAYIQNEVANVLGLTRLPALNLGFADMGMDSLMAVELRNRLERAVGLSFPATLALEYPTISALCTYLAQEVSANLTSTEQAESDAIDHHAAAVAKQDEPIAIIGIGCRFPGANSPEAFWELLRDGRDAVREIPASRWNIDSFYDPEPNTPGKMYIRHGAFLDEVDKFDPHFFGISPREAVSLDPQQRLLLEVTWEALEHAGLAATALPKQTGIFVGIGQNDYAQLQLKDGDPTNITAYDSTGNLFCFASGRLSYLLGLQGPNMIVDTACSSSLVATHLACQSLRTGESDLVIAGGVQLILSPELTLSLSRMQALAPDGRCKTFSAQADGYGRGEGCGIIVLKRLSDAQRDGDNILALIRASAINHDGPSSGLTVPNKLAQEALLRQALSSARIDAQEVGYIEAHGTGTSLGDPIEVRAVASVMAQQRTEPLILGSVKANIGHLEAAAGVSGLIKIVLSMMHGEIPPQLHVDELNPYIEWDQLDLKIPTEPLAWPSRKRIAGVSSFGMSGTNAHVLLEAAATDNSHLPSESHFASQPPLSILTLSAKNQTALRELVSRYHEYLQYHPEVALADVCWTANTGRSHLAHRLSVVAGSSTEMVQKLAMLALPESKLSENDLASSGKINEGTTEPNVAFLFTGQGSQYVNMGRDFYESQPTFRFWLERCAEILRQQGILDLPLLSLLYPTEVQEHNLLDQTRYTQVALFALEYALAKLWNSWGVAPSVVMGHSVGEYVAACVAGVFSLEDGLRLIAQRGRLMQALPQDGQMVVLSSAKSTVLAALEAYSDKVSVAAINGPQNIVISGQSQAVEAVLAALPLDVKTKRLSVSHAFHSPQMTPMLADFERVARSVSFAPPQIAMISNLTGNLVTDEVASADYWVHHIRQPVRFMEGIIRLHDLGLGQLFVEIGPKPVLLGMGRRCLPTSTNDNEYESLAWLPSLRPAKEWQQILHSLGQLYVRGVPVNWSGFDGDYASRRRRLPLPTYPWQHQRYWIERQPASYSNHLNAHSSLDENMYPLVGRPLYLADSQEIRFESYIHLNDPRVAYLADHCVYESTILPGTAYYEMALTAGGLLSQGAQVALEEVAIEQALLLKPEGTRIQLILHPNEQGYRFDIFSLANENTLLSQAKEVLTSQWTRHARGQILVGSERANENVSPPHGITEELSASDLYGKFVKQGLNYGPSFQALKRIFVGDGEAFGEIQLPKGLLSDADGYTLHPVLLDACQHLLGALFPDDGQAILPVGLSRFSPTRPLYPAQSGTHFIQRSRAPTRVWAWAKERHEQDQNGQRLYADLYLFDENDELLVHLERLAFLKSSRQALRSLGGSSDSLYEVIWQAQERKARSNDFSRSAPTETTEVVTTWLIFADKKGLGHQLASQLSKQGAHTVLVEAGRSYRQSGESIVINPLAQGDMQRLLAELNQAGLSLHGIVYLWGLDQTEIEQAAESCGTVLYLLQALVEAALSPRLWLVTRGAQPVTGETHFVGQTPLWGMGQVIALEHPDLQCVCLDLPPLPATLQSESQLLFEECLPDEEGQVAYRDGIRYVSRLVRFKAKTYNALEPFQVKLPRYGSLESLTLEPYHNNSDKALAEGEVEISIRATGLNFREVLVAMGMLKEYYAEHLGIEDASELLFGFEGAGIISRVGKNTNFNIGDEVMASMTTGFLASSVIVKADFVAPKPSGLTFEEAATIPLAFLTARYGLYELAQLRAGDRVLIHSAAGGVGQAAVQLAQAVGAEIFATASIGKWDFLKSQGIKHIYNSRTVEFAEQVLLETDGQGVDVVLNSLTGDFIPASLQALAQGGRFVEIGKLGVWDEETIHAVRPDVAYFLYDLGDVADENPVVIKKLFNELADELCTERLSPLPHKLFSIKNVVDAFGYMQRAKHIGKIVIQIPPLTAHPSERMMINEHGSYLITGGLGALGRQMAEFLVAQGARHLILTGRRGAASPNAQAIVRQLEEKGATVRVLKADVSKFDDVARLLSGVEPPLRGVIHAAGVLDDGVLMQQSLPRFERVMAPKVQGAWYLHQLTEEMPLDFFVLFSSVVSLIGSTGQGNYAAANAFMDGLAHYRRARGLPALSINWGPWADSGMATSERVKRRLASDGWTPITQQQGNQILEMLLATEAAQVGVLPLDWKRFPATNATSLIKALLPISEASESLLEQVMAAVNPHAFLSRHIRAQVGNVLLMSAEEIEPRQRLFDLGLDSLMAVELKNRLEKSMRRSLRPTLLFDFPTLEALVDYLFQEVVQVTPNVEAHMHDLPRDAIIDDYPADISDEELDELSDDDLAELLAEELAFTQAGQN